MTTRFALPTTYYMLPAYLLLHGPFDFSFGLSLFYRFPFFKEPLAFGKSYLYFNKRVLKIYFQWDESISLYIRFGGKVVYLISVQEEFPGPQGIMIHDIPVTVRADMAVK